ncbi:hypothetical protein [Pseudoalteromonas spongiae]|uniref:DUF3592 domain-containing protein n=1 Tax=Pseudoalteromonas spongiae TaxID=298657 RepID=A0ABU8EUT1_9GAMM|nr:hypothetical protein [Pseudoalteromonas spongiae]TMO86645.1 hypothetical protein CWC15_05415 [Pseudoalteromonas spongiae]
MKLELLLVGGLILLWGLEPWVYYFLCRQRKRSWRACTIEKATLVGLQDLMPFHSFKDKQMMLQYCFEQTKHSVIVDYDKSCLTALENNQEVFIFVDPSNPSSAFLYRMPNRIIAYLFPLIGTLLFTLALT